MKQNLELHPVLRLPRREHVIALARERNVPEPQAFEMIWRERTDAIRKERENPLVFGWEPPIWKVCDALLNEPEEDPTWTKRTGMEWDVWKKTMRERLGFRRPVKVLLILGGNRGGKSEYAAKRMSRLLRRVDGARVWPFHSKEDMSVEYQQPLFWKFMPSEWKGKDVRTQTHYVVYRQKTGFSENKFVLPNAAECSFRFYKMDRDDAIEGGNINGYWADELVPPDWVETLDFRIAEKDGIGIVTFTPVQGYTPTVKLFCDGAEVAWESWNFLCPKDGAPRDEARALGFETAMEMEAAHTEGRWSLPEKCDEWIGQEKRCGLGQPAPEQGRTFEKTPRVLRCVNEDRAVVFVHSSDNPYGNPASVARKMDKAGVVFVRERFYGVANRTQAMRFPKFSRRVHVVSAAQIPRTGIRYLLIDPASGRNFFMKWYIVNQEAAFLYREWPGSYEIPGMGVPGPWAVPDGLKLDGKAGPAQGPFGWGLLRYKEEIGRLEGWEGYEKLTENEEGRRHAVREWMPIKPRETIERRFLDSRAATSPRVENDRPKTLLTDFEDLGLYFELTPGDDIGEGVQDINGALDFDENQPLSFFNHPRFYVSDECANSIFALETWSGADGTKGATKDPVDLDRYFFRLGLNQWIGPEDLKPEEGGFY